MEDVFDKATEVMESGAIVDLTQSFRSISFGAMLSISFSKTLEKTAADIYYAQTLSAECNPSKERCKFEFISLRRYDEIVDMARIINTFLHTLMVIESKIGHRFISDIYSAIRQISVLFLNNNYKKLFASIKDAKVLIAKALKDKELRYLHHHLAALDRELEVISHLNKPKESERLLAISRYLCGKSLYLHAITTLYESMTAFIDEECKDDACIQKKIYDRRNCLKKLFYRKKLSCIPEKQSFYKSLSSIDKLRNISAHAFTSDDTDKNIAKTLMQTYDVLQEIYCKRYSSLSNTQKLQNLFSNR
jgi:hypothetical protein